MKSQANQLTRFSLLCERQHQT